MNKEIQKIQAKLQEAKLIREQFKARYDAAVIIVEGQRNTLKSLEERSNTAAGEYLEKDRAVSEFENQLKAAIDKSEDIED